MALNVGTVVTRIAGDTTQLAASLRGATGMLESWAEGLARNMSRRIRAYTERLIAVAIVGLFVRKIRDAAREWTELQEQAQSLGVDPQGLLAARDFADAFGRGKEHAQQFARALKQAVPDANTLAEAAARIGAELAKIQDPIDRQIEATRKLGMVLNQEQIQALVSGQLQPNRSFWRTLGAAAAMQGQSFRWLWDQLKQTRLVQAMIRDSFLLHLGRVGAEMFESEARLQSMILREAARRNKAEEQRRKLAELAEKLQKTEIDLLQSEQRHRAALDLLLERRARLETELRQLAEANDPVALEEKRLELLQTEKDIAATRVRAAQQLEALAKERENRERDLNRELAKWTRVQIGLQKDIESRWKRFYPSLEQIAMARIGKLPLPQARMASEVLWLEKLAPWLRARGWFQQAERAQERAMKLRDQLVAAGFLPEEEGFAHLARQMQAAEAKIAELVRMARQEGLKIKPELDE